MQCVFNHNHDISILLNKSKIKIYVINIFSQYSLLYFVKIM